MVIVQRPPASIRDTAIYKRLAKASEDADGLLSKADRFIEVANPLVDNIAGGPFGTYTLHNRDHARKLAHLAQYLVSEATLEQLTRFECLLIIYASYLHDMGLSLTREDVARNLASADFQEALRGWPSIRQGLDEKRDCLRTATPQTIAGIEMAIADLHKVALTEYLRPKHATAARYKELCKLLRSGLPGEDPFLIRGISFEDELVDICVSHNLDAIVLGEFRGPYEERFSRRLVIADHSANAQFVAAVLRLTDILDFDFERTPRVLFESLGLKNRSLPGSDVTLAEWEKHLAVQQLEIHDSEIVVRAQCAHPAIEAAVRQFCQTIEDEIQKTLSVLRRNQAAVAEIYKIDIPSTVRPDIKAKGYKYLDLSLALDESSVMSLLMGTKLYRTPYAAVRELVQNGADAGAIREKLRPELGQAEVRIFIEQDNSEREWLCVSDNGLGMDEHVLRQYFFKVGRSYYSSPEFDRLRRSTHMPDVHLVARFGIGFLAAFMLADLVEIATRPAGVFPGSPRELGLRVAVERLGALAYVQEDADLPIGTTVRLRLKQSLGATEDIVAEIGEMVSTNVIRPAVTVRLDIPGRERVIGRSDYYELNTAVVERGGGSPMSIEVIAIDLHKYSAQFNGKAILFLARDATTGQLDARVGDRVLELGSSAVGGRVVLAPSVVFKSFGGNRVTVGGFRMIFPKLARILRHGQSTVLAVYDFDVKPGPAVTFDVARTRVLDEKMVLRLELRRAIYAGLQDLGIWQRIAERTRRLIEPKREDDPFRLPIEKLRKQGKVVSDAGLLDEVEKLLPVGQWPVGIHRIVAEKLKISRSLSFNAISTLISEGRAKPAMN